MLTLSIILLVALALVFDFLNGFHDSANAIATIVSTRVLSPKKAVVWAAFFDFMAFFIFGVHVANTIGTGIVKIEIIDQRLIFGALAGACSWNLITWYFGLPTSSSHALIGGLIGAALVKIGPSGLVWKGIIRTTVFIVLSPVIGFLLGRIIGKFVYWLFRRANPFKVDHIFRKGQLVSAALYSMGHGGNDAQKTMGIIASLIFSAGLLGKNFYVPAWTVVSCYGAIAIGVMFGGWRIVKTMGQKVTKLRPIDGFCAETSAAVCLYATSFMGLPVSTTHTITGAIMGVGSKKRFSAVRWGVAGSIAWAWVITIPCSAFVAAGTYYIATLLWKI